VDVGDQLLVGRPLDLPSLGPWLTRTFAVDPARVRAIAMARVLRDELSAAVQAGAGFAVQTVLAPTVRVEGGCAVPTDDAQVVEAVIRRNAIDVVQDQRHLPAVPLLPLPAQRALAIQKPSS
jgi:hypothetical protein